MIHQFSQTEFQAFAECGRDSLNAMRRFWLCCFSRRRVAAVIALRYERALRKGRRHERDYDYFLLRSMAATTPGLSAVLNSQISVSSASASGCRTNALVDQGGPGFIGADSPIDIPSRAKHSVSRIQTPFDCICLNSLKNILNAAKGEIMSVSRR